MITIFAIIAIFLLVVATIIVVWGVLTRWTFKCKQTINWKKFPKEKKKLISTVGGKGVFGFHNYCDWSIGAFGSKLTSTPPSGRS